MTNRKSTKRALLLSSMSILLCFVMLLGTTFAWFTDSVTSANNIIKSGNLDVAVEYTLDGTTWNDLDGADDLFQKGLWEPGHTEVVALKITNKGSLALKYNANMNIVKETTGKTTDGADIVLSDILTVSTLTVEDAGVDPVFGINIAAKTLEKAFQGEDEIAWGTASSFKAGNVLESDKQLFAGSTHYVFVKVDMAETVGNEANHNGTDIPTINFGINVLATQFTYENDSFNNEYDNNAAYPLAFSTIDIDSTATFDGISTLFAAGKSIKATEDIVIDNPAGGRTELVIDGDVHIITEDNAKITFPETTLIRGDGTLTVHDGTLTANQELCVTGDSTLVIEGGTHSFGAFSATSNGKIVVNGGTLNCRGTYAGVMGISFAENGQLIVNGGNLNMYQPFNLNANRCDNAYIEINGGRIELLNGIENLFVVRNIMDKDRTSGVLRGSSIRVNGGTFIANYPIDSAGDATSFIRNGDSPADTNKVLVSNTFNGARDYDCEVKGGTFYGSWQRADNQRYTNGNGGNSDGLFVENSIAGFVANGYQITGDATSGYVVTAE